MSTWIKQLTTKPPRLPDNWYARGMRYLPHLDKKAMAEAEGLRNTAKTHLNNNHTINRELKHIKHLDVLIVIFDDDEFELN